MTMIVVFIIGSCHKDNPKASTKNTTLDSIQRIDSIHTADSIQYITDSMNTLGLRMDSAAGKYWCEKRFSSYSPPSSHFDTLLGYDTITVVKTAYNQIVVNGESFTYRYIPWSNSYGFANGAPASDLTGVDFYAHYDSVGYTYSSLQGAGSGNSSYYRGGKLH